MTQDYTRNVNTISDVDEEEEEEEEVVSIKNLQFIYFDFCLTTIKCHTVQGMLSDICRQFILKYLNLLMKIRVFWHIRPCSLLKVNPCFGKTRRLTFDGLHDLICQKT
jgi:hypothetical protein